MRVHVCMEGVAGGQTQTQTLRPGSVESGRQSIPNPAFKGKVKFLGDKESRSALECAADPPGAHPSDNSCCAGNLMLMKELKAG